MNIKHIAKIAVGQDGAVWNNLLFRFTAGGECFVYDLATVNDCAAEQIAEFKLPKTEILKPHSNSVMFGTEYYSEGDEFPLLYTNIYNNHAKTEDPLKGVCCVYRLERIGNSFNATLVQLIKIGFTEDEKLWCSSGETKDVRPYGNFAIDRESGAYYAFTMRDKLHKTRYFSFNLPKLGDGEFDEKYGAESVTLTAQDIISYFDCEYHRFVQGACVSNGKLYSLEGFTNNEQNPPAMRIIDLESERQQAYIPFADFGLSTEPEFIDFSGDICYYADINGELYIIEF